ncbi:hypothetical protein [Synechococcus sp. CBW1004]|uniref:hypothetical protein n=1 Tax=Synechococcus sp. CBW1004 TaxID=1353136 RepID=UPI0018CE54D8|nr:hypothetical protein [Synechococcus sp. CBW1004]QPN64616.1 hypothetical protein H8F25_07830 [Synechococcus sp. CBW1004]
MILHFKIKLLMISSLPNHFRRQAGDNQNFTSLSGPFRIRKSADLTALLSLPVLAAFALFASPARALPAASLQLFRLDGQGMKPMPAVSALLNATTQSQRPAAATSDVAPQALTPSQSQGQIFVPAEAADRQRSASNPSVLAVSTLSTTTRTGVSQDTALSPSRADEGGSLQLIAQADGSLSDPKVLEVDQALKVEVNPQGGQLTASLDQNSLTLRFNKAIPTDLKGPITVRFINSDDTLGETQQQISKYTVSQDGLEVTLRPGTDLPAGTNFAFQFPSTCDQGPCVYPSQPVGQPLYVGFNSPQVIGPAVLAGAAASTIPTWAVILGVVVVGFGVAAASGAFSSGGGGGTNPSSQ